MMDGWMPTAPHSLLFYLDHAYSVGRTVAYTDCRYCSAVQGDRNLPRDEDAAGLQVWLRGWFRL